MSTGLTIIRAPMSGDTSLIRTVHFNITRGTNLYFPLSVTKFRKIRHGPNDYNSKGMCFYVSNSASAASRGYSAVNTRKDDAIETLKAWFSFVRSVVPGGSWWDLSYDSEQAQVDEGYASPFNNNKKNVSALHALQRMWALLADDKWVLYAGFGALFAAVLSEISMPRILAECVFSAQSGETAVFYRNSKLLIVLCITSGVCSGLRSGCFAAADMILVKRLRATLFSKFLVQDISFFDTEVVGSLTSRLGADCQRLSHTIGNDMHMITRNVLQGTGALINLVTLSWPLALSSLVICSILSAIFFVYGRYQKKAGKFTQELTASVYQVGQETFSSIRTVRAHGTENKELERFLLVLDKLSSIGLRESIAFGLWNLSFNSLYRSTQVSAVLFGGMSIMTGHVSAEQLTKYVLYCEWLIYAAWRLQDSMSSLLQSVGACEGVFRLMDLVPSNQFLMRGSRLQRLSGHIEFVNVSFEYPTNKMVPILKNVSFSVQANEVIAIVGVSGSGKSTLINLLLRLYEPTSGEILIDSCPIGELDTRWLREKIGYVGQRPPIFHMDVKANISYGCVRDLKEEDIEMAAKQAFAHEFISSLPRGYETIVHDDLLSGGQKQRIAIARAFLRHPTILILDEATSALDAENEYYIKEIIQSFQSDIQTKRTVIIIAHRLSTIKSADRILVMDDGQVVEMGNHVDLLRKDGGYARLVKLQTDTDAVVTG